MVEAALRVLGEQGLEYCSMRRVASALDVQPSALYHHVPNKQSLLALMADEIVRGVQGQTPKHLCRSLRGAMLSIRDGADVVATASAFRLGASAVEARLAEMVGADGARTLLLYTFGQAQASQTQLQAASVGVLPGLTLGTHSLEQLEDELARSFDTGVDTILRGLESAARD